MKIPIVCYFDSLAIVSHSLFFVSRKTSIVDDWMFYVSSLAQNRRLPKFTVRGEAAHFSRPRGLALSSGA